MLNYKTVALVAVTDQRGRVEVHPYGNGTDARDARDDWDPFHAIPFGSHGDRGWGDASVLYPSQIACEMRFNPECHVSCIVTLRGAGAIVGA